MENNDGPAVRYWIDDIEQTPITMKEALRILKSPEYNVKKHRFDMIEWQNWVKSQSN